MKKFIVILSILLMAVYYFISPQRIPREGFFRASQEIQMREDTVKPVQDKQGPFTPVRLDQSLAYLDNQFTLNNLVTTDQRLSVSESYYAIYNSEEPGFTVYDALGNHVVFIESNGVPFIFGSRIFSVDHISGIINCYNLSGKMLWSYNVGAYITSLNANNELTVFGGLNGYVTLLDAAGTMLYEYRPSGSASEVIYGTAISPDGQYFGIISGLDPQRFLLFRKGNRAYVPIYHRDLKQQFVQPVRIKFSKNGNLVLYEEPGFLNGFHIGTQEAFSLPIEGKLKDFNTDILGNYFGFLVENNGQSSLSILNHKYLFPLMELSLSASDAVMAVLPSSLVLGVNKTLFLLHYAEKSR